MDQEDIKNYLTSPTDTFDKKYENQSTENRRRHIFCGTSNSNDFLKDSTGNRRFWVVKVSDNINIEKLKEIKDKLWKEAYNAYINAERTGDRDPWVLSDEERKLCNEANQYFSSTDIIYSYVWDYLIDNSDDIEIRASKLIDYVKNDRKFNSYPDKRISEVMQNNFKWIKKQKNDGVYYVYSKENGSTRPDKVEHENKIIEQISVANKKVLNESWENN
jgi:predicted P-loop ATPase